MQSGTVRKWLKKPGDAVNKGDLILQIETDAGIVEIESPLAGRLGQILVTDGKTVPIHADLAFVETDGAAKSGSTSSPSSSAQANSPLTGSSMAPTTPTAIPASSKSTGSPSTKPAGIVTPILMPKAGQSMEEGTINKWHVKPGDVVKQGQVIFEVETDKANMEVEAPAAGRLSRILIGEGKSLAVLLPVAYLAENDADVDLFIASQGGDVSGATGSAASTTAPTSSAAGATAAVPTRESAVSSAAVAEAGRVKASPAARKVANERGVDLHTIATGTGPGGRILSTDVPLTGSPVAKASPAPIPAMPGSRKRMSQMRKAIAKNLLQSKQTIPHFYIRLTVDAGPALAFYQSHKAKYPCSINDVIVLACGRLMKEFPAFRSRLEGDEIVESATANIGIAVGMDDGLVVPVVIGADRMQLQQIGSETRRLAASARAGKIEGMGSGTFTITNLGMFGTEEFAAIINPPEAAILAVGAAREAVVVKDGAMRAGKIMTMTLSADHRIIDGMLAAKFLARLKEILESPEASLQ
jgi:pyruvate dehydrogenase E2 component (dihydrolipoamide acetyltransferase)